MFRCSLSLCRSGARALSVLVVAASVGVLWSPGEAAAGGTPPAPKCGVGFKPIETASRSLADGRLEKTFWSSGTAYTIMRCDREGFVEDGQGVEIRPNRRRVVVTEYLRREGTGAFEIRNHELVDEPDGQASARSGADRWLRAYAPSKPLSRKGRKRAMRLTPRTGAAGNGCGQPKRVFQGFSWVSNRVPVWYLRNNFQNPAYTNAVVAGANAWSNTNNPCGYADQANIFFYWNGYAAGEPGAVDGTSIVDFGDPNAYCAPQQGVTTLACAGGFTYYTPPAQGCGCWEYKEFFGRFRILASGAFSSWHVGSTTTPANGSFDLQSVAVHEFGHTIGLLHTGSEGSQLSMFETSVPYSSSGGNGAFSNGRDLGWGDVCGMRIAHPDGPTGC